MSLWESFITSLYSLWANKMRSALTILGIVIGVGAAIINPDWNFMDAAAALLVSVLIIKVGFDIVIPAFKSAADTAPDEEHLAAIKRVAESIEGVRNAHDIRARSYSHLLYVEVHIVVDPSISVLAGHDIAHEVRVRIREDVPDILDVIVHIDPDNGDDNKSEPSK